MTCSSPDFAAPLLSMVPSSEVMFGSAFSFAGDMGMVSRGTGELDLSVVGAVTEVDMAGSRMTKTEAVSKVSVEGDEIWTALRPG